jgi:hypothetical protein
MALVKAAKTVAMTPALSGALEKGLAGEQLLAVAELIDQVCARRAELNPLADIDEPELRCVLFELLDAPSARAWDHHRGFELFPHFFTGLSEPSPMGVSIGELVYEYGLPDYDCPSREQLIAALQWALREQEQLVD